MNLPLHNYISRSNSVFVSNQQNMDVTFKMIQQVLSAPATGDRDLIEASKLAETFILHCKDAVAGYIAGIASLIVRRFAQRPPKKPPARTNLLKVLCCCFLARSDLALYALESLQATAPMMQAWFTAIVMTEVKDMSDGSQQQVRSHFKAEGDKKLCALGLTAILRHPFQNLPKSMQDGFGHIIAAVVTVLNDIEALRKRSKAPPPQPLSHGNASGQMDRSHQKILDVDDDKDDDTKAARSMDEVYAKLSQLEDGTCTFAELFGEEDEEDEEETFSSPIDDMDELLFFAHTFHELQTTNQAVLEHATNNVLNPQQKSTLALVLGAANQKVASSQQQQQVAAASPEAGAQQPT